MRRALLVSSIATALFFAPSLARADSRKACVEAADHGQELRDKGKLIEARQAFVSCARDECPAMVSRQCTTWLADVDHELPTITIRARDAQNKDLVEVNVIVDDVLRTSTLDGRPMQIDPGVHKLRFMHEGDPDVDQQVVIRSAEKDRLIDVHFAAKAGTSAAQTSSPTESGAPPPAEAPKSGFRFPLFAGVMLGVGLAAGAGMAVLLGTTVADVNQMRATCAGSCKQSDVDWANTRIILANVAMGVGIAGLSLAVVSIIVANVGGHSSSTEKAAWHLQVGPGSVGLLGTF